MYSNVESGNFQRSWSIHHGNRVKLSDENDYFESQRNLQRSMSTRQPKINLEKRFGESSYHNQGASNEGSLEGLISRPTIFNRFERNHINKSFHNGASFQFKPNHGMKLRSLTDTNLHKLEIGGMMNGYQNLNSPKSYGRRQPLRQIPERIAPIWNNIQSSMSQAGPKTEKFFQRGGEKFTKAIQGVRTSFNSFSQKFKKSTRRHYKLDGTPTSRRLGADVRTPPHNCVTPGQLYSPFDVTTPRTPHSYLKAPKRLQHMPHNKRSLYGKENYGMHHSPSPSVHFHQKSYHNKANWVHFNSPARQYENVPHQYQNVPHQHYRRDHPMFMSQDMNV